MFEFLANEAAKLIFKKFDERLKVGIPGPEIIAPDIQCAIIESYNWSRSVQMFGMAAGASTAERTIDLDFGTPRRFVTSDNIDELVEQDLTDAFEHTVILGDPGAGKTTTFKRLVVQYLSAIEKSKTGRCPIPIVIVLRELSDGDELAEIICAKIGLIRYCKRKTEDGSPQGGHQDRRGQLFLGDSPLRTALPKLLDELDVVIFFDGLDETSPHSRISLEKEIAGLARSLRRSTLFVSCRSGDFIRLIEGFRIVEIKPLDEDQIRDVVDKWLPEPDNFFNEVEKNYNLDILNRPLLLTQLLLVYQKANYLPSQPSVIYRRLLELLLKDWDEQRNVLRKSVYSEFEREQKYDFLCALAYHLTYATKVSSFSHDQLVGAYRDLCARFSLPKGQAVEVANEIESHTGIIVNYADGKFAFSHLTLQEYLCASHLVREPFAALRRKYLIEYPAPLAVAAALSSDPSRWLGFLILELGNGVPADSWCKLFDRIVIENPRFTLSPILGLGLLQLALVLGNSAEQVLSELLRYSSVSKSIGHILMNYVSCPSEFPDMVSIRPSPKFPLQIEGKTMPATGILSRNIFALSAS